MRKLRIIIAEDEPIILEMYKNIVGKREDYEIIGTATNGKRKWQPTPVFLPGESQGRRSLVGYSPRGRKELDTTEQLHFTSHWLFTNT